MNVRLGRTIKRMAAVFIMSSMALTGCGLSNSSDANGGGENIIIGYGDIDTLEPTAFKSDTASTVVGNIYGTLFAQQYEEQDGVLVGTDEYVPSLAESATYSDDGKTLTIELKPDLTFADDSPLTSEDVVYTLQRSLSDVGYTGIFASYLRFSDPVDGIRAIDETTVEIETDGESPLLEKFLSFQTFGILSKAAADTNGKEEWATDYFAGGGVASGPYMIAEKSAGTSVALVKNPAYSVADLSDAPQKVTIINQPSHEQAYLALKNGSIDMALGTSPDLAADASKSDDVKVYNAPTGGLYYLGMNQDVPALQDVRVRQAIAYMAPYAALRDEVMAGFAGPAYGPDPYPMSGSLDQEGTKQAYDTDADAAKALLRKAGVTDLSLTMTIPASDPIAVKSATFIQSALKEGGITVKVDKLADADYYAAIGDGTTQLFIGQWLSWGGDSVYQLNFLLRTGQYTNYARYSNAEFDDLLDQAMGEASEAARFKLGKQAQQIAIDDAPWAFLFTRESITLARPNVGGLTQPDDLFPRLQYLTLS